MQQKLHSKGCGSFLLERNGQACGAGVVSSDPPLHCPRCGSKRFCSLASLCAHLEYQHSYRPPEGLAGGFSITGKPPDPLTSAAIPWHDTSPPAYRGQQSPQRWPHARSLSDSRGDGLLPVSVRRRTQSVGVGTRVQGETQPADVGEEDEEGKRREGSGDEDHIHPLRLPFPPAGHPLDPDLDLVGRLKCEAKLLEQSHKKNSRLTSRGRRLLRAGDSRSFRRRTPAAGRRPAGCGRQHASAAGSGEHRAGPDGHGAAV